MFKGIVFVITFLVLMAGASFPAPGDLDKTFSGDGVVTYDRPGFDYGHAVAVQPNGKIVVVGETLNIENATYDVLVLRYNSNGTLDKTFGRDGVVTYNGVANSYDSGLGVAIQSDGKIVITGTTFNGSNLDVLVLRFNSDGTLDPSFGVDGVVTYNGIWNSDDYCKGIAIQSDGKIVVTGGTGIEVLQPNWDVLVLRFNSDGTLYAGVTYNNTAFFNDYGAAVAIQPDGKIVVTGVCNEVGLIGDLLVLRFNYDLTWDNTFGKDGVVTYSSGSGTCNRSHGIAIQADGMIVVSGYTTQSTPWGLWDIFVLRYDSDGILDTTFGEDGVVTYNYSWHDYGNAVTIQPNGKIVVVGQTLNDVDYDVLVLRYNSNGTLDTTFSKDGVFMYNYINRDFDDVGAGVAIQQDGKIVVTGYTSGGALLTLRLIGDPPISLITPNGGETLPSGSTYTIRWGAPSQGVKFNLMYSLDNGITWNLITQVPVTGISYDWAVPKPLSNKKECLVKVIGFNSKGVRVGADKSDAPFRIEVVKLNAPSDPGISVTSGDIYPISWTTNETKRPVAKVKRYYTRDGGITWFLIDKLMDPLYLTKGTHSYPWTVPTVLKTKTKCKVRVDLIDALGTILATDASDDYFTIKPSGVLLKRTPLGGFYALGTAPPPESNTFDDVLTPLPALIDNNFNTGIATINLSTTRYHNIGILVSSGKSVDRLFIYVNRDVSADTNLTNPSNWRAYKSDSNAVGTWQQIPIMSVTVSAFDILNNIYRYEIRFSAPQNASYFKAVNMETVNAFGITDVLVTEIEAYGTD